jgi:hypothetical protein
MTQKNHIMKVENMRLHPWIIGLEGIALSASESALINNGRLVREPDNLMFNPQEHTIYNVEYKSHNCYKNRHRAKKQLSSCKNYLNQIFLDWDIINLYISGDYKIERI